MTVQAKSSEGVPCHGYDWRHDWQAALLVLVVLVVLLSTYACVLNAIYYRTDAPFFDSAAYTNEIAEINGTVRHQGVVKALHDATTKWNAPLPPLEVIALTWLDLIGSNLSRRLGVTLQAVWLFVLALTLFYYWVWIRGRNAWASVASTMPFFLFAAIFDFNGGLSDFRLDLSLYIFASSAESVG